MKKKARKVVAVKRSYRLLDGTTFMLLACVTIVLLALFAWQTGTLPDFLR